jgi:hypothetical protein
MYICIASRRAKLLDTKEMYYSRDTQIQLLVTKNDDGRSWPNPAEKDNFGKVSIFSALWSINFSNGHA